MNQKKNRGLLITIIILLVMIILLGGIIAYLYFFTDILKSNKQLFFEYSSQLIQTKEGFLEDNLIQYFQKRQSTSYENNGEVSFDISIPDLEEELETTNNSNITFSGKTDPSNSKSEQEISLNYSDSVNFPLTYRRNGNISGIQTQYIGNNYVAIKNDEELSGFDDINNIINMSNIQFSSEEIQNLKTTYFDNILNNLEESKFSKVTEENLTGYKLTLTGEEFKNVLSQILTTLKTDENTMNKIKVILDTFGSSLRMNSNSIDNLINDINDLELNDNIELTVYDSNRELQKIDFTIEGNTVSISKDANNQEATYTASVKSSDGSRDISISATYTGITSDNVNEKYEILLEGASEEDNSDESATDNENDSSEENTNNTSETENTVSEDTETNTLDNETNSLEKNATNSLEQNETNTTENETNATVENNTNTSQNQTNSTTDNTSDSTDNGTISYKYTITNNVQFKDSVEIEDLSDENAVILNDRDQEYVNKLMNAISERLDEVNRLQMEELGVSEDENPIKYIIPEFLFTRNNKTQVNEEAVGTFNEKFELYQSTNTKGATVKGLLTTIQNNNETEGNDKIEEINVDGEEYEVTEQNITLIKSNINVDDDYRVEFEKDSDTGLIYRVVINKR